MGLTYILSGGLYHNKLKISASSFIIDKIISSSYSVWKGIKERERELQASVVCVVYGVTCAYYIGLTDFI